MKKTISFAFASLAVLALTGAAHAREPVAASAAAPSVNALVSFVAVDRVTGAPHVNSSYGEIRFFAVDEEGNRTETEREGTSFVFTRKGRYRIGGQSVYNFCYSDSADVYVDEHTVSVQVRLFVSCE